MIEITTIHLLCMIAGACIGCIGMILLAPSEPFDIESRIDEGATTPERFVTIESKGSERFGRRSSSTRTRC